MIRDILRDMFHRRGRGAAVAAVLFVVAIVWDQPAAAGGPDIFTAEQTVTKRVEAEHIDDLIKQLDLSDQQRRRVREAHAAYEAELKAVHERVLRRMRDAMAVFREAAEESRDDGDRGARPQELLDEEELPALHDEIIGAKRRGRDEADRARRQLLDAIHELLDHEQAQRWEPARRTLRRSLSFRPIRESAPRRDLDRHVELPDVWRNVLGHDDLAELRAAHHGETKDRMSALSREIEQRLDRWAAEIDAIIVEHEPYYAKRDARYALERARMARRDQAVERAWKRRVSAWRLIHSPTHDTAIEIEHLLREGVGWRAAERWRAAYDEALAPGLLGPEMPDLMADVLRDQDWLDEKHRDAVERIHQAYVAQRRGLRDRALGAMIEWQAERQRRMVDLAHEIPDPLEAIEDRRRELAERAVELLREHVPADHRDAFDRHRRGMRNRSEGTLHPIRY